MLYNYILNIECTSKDETRNKINSIYSEWRSGNTLDYEENTIADESAKITKTTKNFHKDLLLTKADIEKSGIY